MVGAPIGRFSRFAITAGVALIYWPCGLIVESGLLLHEAPTRRSPCGPVAWLAVVGIVIRAGGMA
jgi:hypothetical protein